MSGGAAPAGGGWPGRSDLRLLAEADLVVGARRHVEAAERYLTSRARCVVLGRGGLDLSSALDLIGAEIGRVCVLASGDPGFFGITRALAERFGPGALDIRPAPPSVAVAWARVGLPWDDAAVVSAHGRPLDAACAAAARHDKVAVLTSPDSPPGEVARALASSGTLFDNVAVATYLGEPGERIETTTVAALASHPPSPADDSPSVVLLWRGDGIAPSPAVSWPADPARVEWGLPADTYSSAGGLVTKPEVRSVVLAHLALAPSGVLWDVGAGSGSVGIEAALVFPRLHVLSVEKDRRACDRIAANARAAGVAVDVVRGEAPAAFAGIPSPDSVFVGGGGLSVLDEARVHAGPSGRVVATFAALDRAVDAHRILGNLTEIGVSSARSLPDGGLRLAAENPVFVTWGPGR